MILTGKSGRVSHEDIHTAQQGLKEFEDLEAALPKLSGVIQISGCIDAAKPHMMYSIGQWFWKQNHCYVSGTKSEGTGGGIPLF